MVDQLETKSKIRAPLEVRIVSKRSAWRAIVDFIKDIAAVLAFITAAAAIFLPQVEFAKLINIFTGIGESSNPPSQDTTATVSPQDEIAVGVAGWSYLGRADEVGEWNYTRVDGQTIPEAGLWKAKTSVFVRTSPVTALVPSPEELGVVNEGICFRATAIRVNDRTKSIWLNGQLSPSCVQG